MGPPLDGISIVSLAGQLPGPFGTMILADLGADVILVERPVVGDPARRVPGFHSVTRGCRSVALDLKQDEGRAQFLDLCRSADAVLEGFRPGVARRLGVGADDVRDVNPDALYVSVSGFGQAGPYAQRPGHDIVYQAVAGVLHEAATDSRRNGAPPLVPWADLAGGVFTAIGVLTGLLQRTRTGVSPTIDLSLADAAATMMTPLIASASAEGVQGLPATPGYGVYWTCDDVPVAFGIVHEDHLWDDMCHALGRHDLAGLTADRRWDDHRALDAELRRTIGESAWPDLHAACERANVAFSRVNRLDELTADPHLMARGIVQPGTPTVVHQPLRFDAVHPKVADVTVPRLGQHNDEQGDAPT